MAIFMAILSGLLIVYSIFALAGFLLTKDRQELYDLTLIVFVTVTIVCAMLTLLNDAIVYARWYTQLATQALLELASVYLLVLIVAVIIQCCKSEFKMKWDSDGLILMCVMMLSITGCVTLI